MISWILISMGTSVFCQIPSSNGAAEFGQRQKEATRLRLAEDKVRVKYLRREEASLLEGIHNVDRSLIDSRTRLLLLERRKVSLSSQREAARASLGEQTEVTKSLKIEVRDRLAAMHRLKRKPILDLILAGAKEAINRSNTRRRLRDYLAVVFSHDAGLIRELHQRLQKMKALNSSLSDQEHAILNNQISIQDAMEVQLLLQVERTALLAGIRKERRLVERLRSEIAKAAKQIDREAKLTRGLIPAPPAVFGGFRLQKGRLPWPVAGRIEVPFGKQVDPDSGLVLLHHGVDLRTPHGVVVRAIHSGTVRFAGRLDGYGELVILDHGRNWHSVYGHLSNVSVRLGQKVKTSRALGRVSDLDSNKGPYLYFEIRKRHLAVDPLSWMSPG
jgi:murein hydrolase activator